ncbi:DNA modification methylase [Spirochaetia bacterium]|nr:DNA modification methylase [Spirochaetia bacterium]
MKYTVTRNEKYDYAGQSYASIYPNLHKYPATMIPQIGIEILKEFNISNGKMLDPYCGSGTSFVCGLECGITTMFGFDINPLAILIAKAKFTKISERVLTETRECFRNNLFETLKDETFVQNLSKPEITNIDFWFSKSVIENLSLIKYCIENIKNKNVKTLFYVPFSETVRDCSYTRNNEFKLYKMKPEDVLNFNPDVISLFFKKLDDVILYYKTFYLPKLSDGVSVCVNPTQFKPSGEMFDVVLTSPPYGDSRTTVAYGQFSTLSNEWLGINNARKIDAALMGGIKAKYVITNGVIADSINKINTIDTKRALEVSSFYNDLEASISNVSSSIKKGGKSIYVVGNRTVKNTELPTDQFIAENFEKNGFKHLITYKRALSNKSMPCRNSPTNKAGATVNTMLYEYIVVCEKTLSG